MKFFLAKEGSFSEAYKVRVTDINVSIFLSTLKTFLKINLNGYSGFRNENGSTW